MLLHYIQLEKLVIPTLISKIGRVKIICFVKPNHFFFSIFTIKFYIGHAPMGEFRGNVAHSATNSGFFFDRGLKDDGNLVVCILKTSFCLKFNYLYDSGQCGSIHSILSIERVRSCVGIAKTSVGWHHQWNVTLLYCGESVFNPIAIIGMRQSYTRCLWLRTLLISLLLNANNLVCGAVVNDWYVDEWIFQIFFHFCSFDIGCDQC